MAGLDLAPEHEGAGLVMEAAVEARRISAGRAELVADIVDADQRRRRAELAGRAVRIGLCRQHPDAALGMCIIAAQQARALHFGKRRRQLACVFDAAHGRARDTGFGPDGGLERLGGVREGFRRVQYGNPPAGSGLGDGRRFGIAIRIFLAQRVTEPEHDETNPREAGCGLAGLVENEPRCQFRVTDLEARQEHVSRRYGATAPRTMCYYQYIPQRSGGHFGPVCPNSRQAPLHWRRFPGLMRQLLCQQARR